MKISSESLQVQVGAFVLIGLVIGMFVIFKLGSEKKLFESQYELVCYFDDISGLRTGAPIQLAGIRVGTVKSVHFDPDLNQKKVKLVLNLTQNFQNRIRLDSVAGITSQGLLGDKMVFITVGSADQPVLKNGDRIESASNSGFSQMIEKGDKLIVDVSEAVGHINAILNELRKGDGVIHSLVFEPGGDEAIKDLRQAMRNLNLVSQNAKEITDKINSGQGTLGAIINDASVYNDLKTLLGKANRNKLIRAVIRHTLKTKEEQTIKP